MIVKRDLLSLWRMAERVSALMTICSRDMPGQRPIEKCSLKLCDSLGGVEGSDEVDSGIPERTVLVLYLPPWLPALRDSSLLRGESLGKGKNRVLRHIRMPPPLVAGN